MGLHGALSQGGRRGMAGSPLRKSRDAHTETPVVPQVARRSGGEMRCPQTQQRLKDAGSVCPSSSLEEGVAMVRPHLCLEEGTALVLGSGLCSGGLGIKDP